MRRQQQKPCKQQKWINRCSFADVCAIFLRQCGDCHLSPCTFQSTTKFAAKISLSLRIFRTGLGEPLNCRSLSLTHVWAASLVAHNSTVCRKARSYQKTHGKENHGITVHQTAVCNTNATFQQFKHDIRANYCGGDITALFGTQRRTPELYCSTHISQTRHFHGVSTREATIWRKCATFSIHTRWLIPNRLRL